jgi:acetyl-CoA carboxylase biotin carboxyl carrier protein
VVTLSSDEIKEILEFLEASGWNEAHITVGDSTISVSKSGGRTVAPAPPAPAPAAPTPAAAAPPAPPSPTGEVISSPSVGVFWRSPEPGAPPFVEVGDTVAPGANLCIVEVMKLMNYVTAAVAGVVIAIHVENGNPVEHGSPLFTIEPSGG